jgi:UDPglucose 6-dehydrogenase
VLVTEWPEFAKLDLKQLARRMSKQVLIDGRNLFQAGHAREAGFEYSGIGRALPRPAANAPQTAKAGHTVQ